MYCRRNVVAAVLLAVSSLGCGIRPRARLLGIHFGDLDRAALDLVFDVEIVNPYSVRMPLTNMNYNLSSRGTELAAGGAKPNTMIAVGAREKAALPVRVHYGEILRRLKDVEPGSRIPYEAELVLVVDGGQAGEVEVPLRKKGKVTLPFISGVTYKRILELLEYK